MALTKTNLVSKAYSGKWRFTTDQKRNYFFIVLDAGATGTIEFGDGGGKIPLKAETYYEPYVCSLGIIQVDVTGGYTINTNASTHEIAVKL